jgi:hypothetical protein
MGLPTSPAALGEPHLEGLAVCARWPAARLGHHGSMATAKAAGAGAVLVKPAYRRLFARSDRLPLGKTFNTVVTVVLAVLVARTLTSSQWPSVPGRGL